nr:MAG: hypothetical protein DIU78_24395 [Pseudomonadota bacterium]
MNPELGIGLLPPYVAANRIPSTDVAHPFLPARISRTFGHPPRTSSDVRRLPITGVHHHFAPRPFVARGARREHAGSVRHVGRFAPEERCGISAHDVRASESRWPIGQEDGTPAGVLA